MGAIIIFSECSSLKTLGLSKFNNNNILLIYSLLKKEVQLLSAFRIFKLSKK